MRRMQVSIELGAAASTARGLTQLVKQLQEVGAAAKATRATLQSVGSTAGRLAVGTRTSAAGRLTAGTRTSAAGTATNTLSRVSGPHQRLVKAQEALHEALQRGTLAEIADAQLALEKAKAAVEKLRAGTPLKIASGAEQRLVQAQRHLSDALTSGTQEQIDDARAGLDKAANAVEKQRHRGGLDIRGPNQTLAKARADLTAALQQGTQDEIRDAEIALKNAEKALGKASGGGGGAGASVRGPHARVAKARADLQKALQSGIDTQVRDAEIQLRRAQESLTRATRPAPRSTLGGRLAALALSTRVNLPGMGGFGASPLVGRLLTAIGATGPTALLLGGLAAGLTVAVGAVKMFAETVQRGAESLAASAAAGTVSGGTSGQVAGLQAIGIDPNSIAALAASVRNARSSNPFAAATFGFQMPRPFGEANEAKGLQEVINKLAGFDAAGRRLSATEDKLNTSTRRLTAARMVELDSILPSIEAIRRRPRFFSADAAARAQIADKKAVIAAQDLAYATQRAASGWELFTQALSKPFLRDLTQAAHGLGSATRDLGKSYDSLNRQHPRATTYLSDLAIRHTLDSLLPGLGPLFGWLKGMGGKDTAAGADPATKATQANTTALIDLSKLIKDGTYGGGDRARGAFPKYLVPAAAASKMDWNSIRYGFWKL